MEKKKTRCTFDRQDKIKLKELVKEMDGGGFLKSLLSRDMATNNQKHTVWLQVRNLFCEQMERDVTVQQIQRLWYRILADSRKRHDKSLIEFEKSCKATGGGHGTSPPEGMF
jgi:hypothetical protein